MAFDRVLFRTINGWPDALGAVLKIFSTAPDYAAFKIILTLIVLGMVIRGGKPRRAAIVSVIAFPLADFLCNMAKHADPDKRPYQELANVINRVGLSESAGTASSHAANLAAVATVMSLNLGLRWGSIWIVIAFLVGLSRVYVGAHYPSQVLLGWTIGVGSGVLINGIAHLLVRSKASGTPVIDPTSIETA